MEYFSYMGNATAKNALGAHIRMLRDQRQLTLVTLAELTGISRATLSRIENGEVSPTAEALGRLSTGLETPISQIISPLEQKFSPLVPRDIQTRWYDPKHNFERVNVSPPSRQLAIELVRVSLGAQQTIKYPSASILGQEHHLYMLSGELLLTVDGIEYQLSAGDCLRYKLYGETIFQTAKSDASYLLALT